jgi:hypothetical protein
VEPDSAQPNAVRDASAAQHVTNEGSIMEKKANVLSGGRGILICVILFGLAGFLTYHTLTTAPRPVPVPMEVTFMCSEKHMTFEYAMKEGERWPVTSPFTGRKTGYPAERCYWTSDGKRKATPTYVILNENLGLPGDTICPDCRRIVVGHNPPPPPDTPLAEPESAALHAPAGSPAAPTAGMPATSAGQTPAIPAATPGLPPASSGAKPATPPAAPGAKPLTPPAAPGAPPPTAEQPRPSAFGGPPAGTPPQPQPSAAEVEQRRAELEKTVYATTRAKMNEWVRERARLLKDGKSPSDPQVRELEASILEARRTLLEKGEAVSEIEPPIPQTPAPGK